MCWSSKMGITMNDKHVNYSHGPAQTKQQVSKCIVRTRTDHEQTQTHKIHHSPDLGEANTFPLMVFSVPGHKAYTQMSFCTEAPNLGVLKFPKLGLPQLWRPITSCENLRLKWSPKQSYSPCRKLSNNMWHITCTQVIQGNAQLLVVGSQIGSWTPDFSFGHNLYFNYPNGSWEPILDIYVSRAFQWYK